MVLLSLCALPSGALSSCLSKIDQSGRSVFRLLSYSGQLSAPLPLSFLEALETLAFLLCSGAKVFSPPLSWTEIAEHLLSSSLGALKPLEICSVFRFVSQP